MRLKQRQKDAKEKVAVQRIENKACICSFERKQLGRSQP